MGMDELQCLLVFGRFVAGMVEKRMDSLAGLVLHAVYAGDVTFCQAAFLHPAFGTAQIPRAVQIPRFAALAGFPIFRQVLQYAPQQPIFSVPFIERSSLQRDRSSENRCGKLCGRPGENGVRQQSPSHLG